jgi:hypothetical protein
MFLSKILWWVFLSIFPHLWECASATWAVRQGLRRQVRIGAVLQYLGEAGVEGGYAVLELAEPAV